MEETKVYDLVLANGTVIDVVEGRYLRAHIGIDGDRIAALSPAPLSGRRVIDAAGKMISPGFLDFHSHVDGNPYAAECLVQQGGTTTLGGERNLNGKLFK